MSALYTGAAQEWMGSGEPLRVDGVAQPAVSIRVHGERMVLKRSFTWCLDSVAVERLPAADWEEYGDSSYPWPETVETKIERLRTEHLSDPPSARRPDPLKWADSGLGIRDDVPYWAAVPALGSNEASASSMGFGWPFRATLREQVLRRDATTGLVEDPQIWETRTEEVFDALAWRPILPGLLADGLVFGGTVWLGWMALASMVRRALVSGGRCAHCGHLSGAREVAAHHPCPECGLVPPTERA